MEPSTLRDSLPDNQCPVIIASWHIIVLKGLRLRAWRSRSDHNWDYRLDGQYEWTAQVVPETVGSLLDEMVVLRSQRMRPLPARIDRAALREHAQLQQRAQLAALARRIAAFAEGMRAMEK